MTPTGDALVWYELALALGSPVGKLMSDVSSVEFSGWKAFRRQCGPLDRFSMLADQVAKLCQIVATFAGDKNATIANQRVQYCAPERPDAGAVLQKAQQWVANYKG